MKTAIILHDTLGSPEGNWFQWLKGELETKGMQIWLPQLPHAEQPSLSEWAQFLVGTYDNKQEVSNTILKVLNYACYIVTGAELLERMR